MTTRYKTQAFVFGKKDINESDRVFSVFTDNFGRLDIFAKAIRKNASKLRSGIDSFFISEIEFIQGKNRKTLTDAIKIDRFENIYKDLEKLKIANRIGEILDNFIKGEEKDQKLFSLIEEIFLKLNGEKLDKEKCSMVYYYFLWSAISLLGYHPQVEKCNICSSNLNPYNIYFSNKLGGIICKKCLGHDNGSQKINSDIVKILRIIFKKDWSVFSRLKIEKSSQNLFVKVSDNYYSYIQ